MPSVHPTASYDKEFVHQHSYSTHLFFAFISRFCLLVNESNLDRLLNQ